jgi:DNA processing protein
MPELPPLKIPKRLTRIAQPPKQLFWHGSDPEALLARPCVAIVGSRAVSPYGRQVTRQFAAQLAERGVVIISGLAFGVDSIAHQAALEAGGLTIAVLPGSVDEVYPRSHARLAEEILAKGGALVSEYPAGTAVLNINFIARNRLIAGLADTTFIPEAALKSGSLHTAGFTIEQGKTVMAVPGPITSPTSVGTNNLIKSGAVPITSLEDLLHALNLEGTEAVVQGSTPEEQRLIDLLGDGISDGQKLLVQSGLPVQTFNQALVMLEINGKVRALGNNYWSLCR